MSETGSLLTGLVWKEDSRSWAGSLKLASGLTVAVTVRAISSLSKEVSPASRSTLARLVLSESEIRRAVANSVVDEINDHWRTNPGRVKTKQITQRLEPIELSIAIDGSAKIIYTDDGLFWGHPLSVQLSSVGTLESTCVLDS